MCEEHDDAYSTFQQHVRKTLPVLLLFKCVSVKFNVSVVCLDCTMYGTSTYHIPAVECGIAENRLVGLVWGRDHYQHDTPIKVRALPCVKTLHGQG